MAVSDSLNIEQATFEFRKTLKAEEIGSTMPQSPPPPQSECALLAMHDMRDGEVPEQLPEMLMNDRIMTEKRLRKSRMAPGNAAALVTVGARRCHQSPAPG